MDNNEVSSRQMICMMGMLIIGSSAILSIGSEAKQDAGIAIVIATITIIPIVILYSRLASLYPGKDFFEILDLVYGKYLGYIITILFTWYIFHVGTLVLRNFSEFITAVSIPDTPHFALFMVMGLLSVWITKSGIEVLGRISVVTLPLLVFDVLLLSILSLPLIDIDLVRPLFYNDFKPILKGTFAVMTFPYGELVIFLVLLSNVKNQKKGYSRLFIISILIGGSTMFLAAVRNILVLGIETISKLYFPSYAAARLINIGNFFQRVEVLISAAFLFSGLIKISICVYASCKGFAKIFRIKNYKVVVAPVTLLMMHLASIIYESTMEMFDWTVNIGKYYDVPFQFFIPLLTLVIAEIRLRTRKKKPLPNS